MIVPEHNFLLHIENILSKFLFLLNPSCLFKTMSIVNLVKIKLLYICFQGKEF